MLRDSDPNILKNALLNRFLGPFLLLLLLSGLAIGAEIYASIVLRDWLNVLSEESISAGAIAFGFLIPTLYVSGWLLNALFFKFDIDIRFRIYEYAFNQFVKESIQGQLNLLQQKKSGRMMSDIRNASESVANIFNMLAFYGLRFVIVLISTIILLGSILWWAPLLVLFISLFAIILSYRQQDVCINYSKTHVADQGVTTGNLVEIFERIRIVKTFKQEDSTLASVKKDIDKEGESKRGLRRAFLQLNLIQIFYKATIMFVFLGVGVVNYVTGNIQLGSLAMLITFSMTLSAVIEDLTTRLYELVSNYIKYQQVVENLQNNLNQSGEWINLTGQVEKKLQVSNLSLWAGDRLLLDQVNLNLSADKKVALMGPSGCGKTSLAECILGIRSFQGSIKHHSVHQSKPLKIVEVEQTPVHIGDTFWEWLTFGNPSASGSLVYKAVQATCLGEILKNEEPFKAELKDGLTLSGLSGGQKQRAAIARALITEPDFIILDEPTAALDHATATTILNQIMLHGVGALIITHDKDSSHLFDEVYHFEDGSLHKKM